MSKKDGLFDAENQPENAHGEVHDLKVSVTQKINAKLKGAKSSRQTLHVKDDVLEYIGDKLFSSPAGKRSWMMQFVDATLKEAKSNPKSYQAQRLTNIIMPEDLLEQLQLLYSMRMSNDRTMDEYRVRKTLYDLQQQVYDNEVDKKILIINSRRSGKTELMGRLAVKDLLKDGHRVVYINRNSSSAVRQIRKPLMDSLSETSLEVVKGSVDSQEMHFSNGSMMLILGNNNASDIDKLRGEKASLVILDECAHQRNVRTLVREVIRPLMMDYGKDSRLIMVGTPPRNRGTYIEEAWEQAEERGWKKYHWTYMDNPYIEDKRGVIPEVCKENGCDENSAFIRREYLGEMGAYDTESKVIRKWSNVNPRGSHWERAYIGVDWGYEDKAAIVTILIGTDKIAYVDRVWSESKRGIKEISERIRDEWQRLHDNYTFDHLDPWIICDTNEKGAVNDLALVYKLPNVFCAYKYDKDMALEQLSDLFSSGKMVVTDNAMKNSEGEKSSIVEDLEYTLYERDEETDRIRHVIDDDVWHPNSLMACLYVSRQYAYDVLHWYNHNKTVRDLGNLKDLGSDYYD